MNKVLTKRVKQIGKCPQIGVALSRNGASVTFKLKESKVCNIL